MKPETGKVKLSSIQFKDSLYPREKHDPALVQQYADCLDQIEAQQNFISITQDGILLDGRHRHLAYLTANRSNLEIEIPVFIYPALDERQIFALAVELNSDHGQQLSPEHKRQSVVRLYSQYGYTIEEIAKKASVRKETALAWTKSIRQDEQKRLDETIFDMYLACHTQEEIAQTTGASRQTITDRLKVLPEKFPGTKSAKVTFSEEDWKPPIYNVWTFAKNTNEVSHPGNSEQRIVENLIYKHTQPLDIVIDPFAGGGSTIDICRKRMRRYWASDRLPIPARENEIRKLDICQELPDLHKRWAEVTLTFLDPPYWKQAEGKYSSDPEDLANMTLDDFTANVAGVVKRIAGKQTKGVIAMLMQPTQWNAPDHQFTDHVLDIINAVGNKKVRLENRISVPYSTEQCTPQMVDWAKETENLLVISRELIIWRI